MAKSSKTKKMLKKDFYAVLKNGLELPQYAEPRPHGEMKKSFRSIRKSEYRGHEIRIETTYKISIDRQPFLSHTKVLDDGSVHCHDFPNYSFPSAVDMVRKVISAQESFDPPDDQLGAMEHKL